MAAVTLPIPSDLYLIHALYERETQLVPTVPAGQRVRVLAIQESCTDPVWGVGCVIQWRGQRLETWTNCLSNSPDGRNGPPMLARQAGSPHPLLMWE